MCLILAGGAASLRHPIFADLYVGIMENLFAAQGGLCALCGEAVELWKGPPAKKLLPRLRPSIDHIKPLCRGGTSDVSNLQLVHRGCNRVKGELFFEDKQEMLLTIQEKLRRKGF